jgi:hypothetical protein
MSSSRWIGQSVLMASTEELSQRALALTTAAFDELNVLAGTLSREQIREAWLGLPRVDHEEPRATWSRYAAMALLGGIGRARSGET